MSICEKAYAKLNISLDVFKARQDGYHDMKMIMQTVSLHDDVCITFDNSKEIRSTSNFGFIPNDNTNLAVKAALSYFEASGIDCPGMLIDMQKSIPVGAGMAGGSADAAAVLRALNKEYKVFNESELLKVSEKVGSDVPYCVVGGTYLAEGRGEILTKVPEIPDCDIVICKPTFSISTPEFFRALDKIKLRVHPDTEGIISSLNSGDINGVARRMYNVFEDVDDRKLNVVKDIKSQFFAAGALGSIMTGTGSAVFGIFQVDSNVDSLIESLENKYGFCIKAKPIGKLL